MTKEKYDSLQREERKAARERQVKKQITIIGICLAVVLGVNIYLPFLYL